MSRESLTEIVSRALTDEDFRKKILDNLEDVLKDFDLDDAEKKLLSNLNAETFDELTMNLEDRQSKSGFFGRLSLMGGKDGVDASDAIDLLSNKFG